MECKLKIRTTEKIFFVGLDQTDDLNFLYNLIKGKVKGNFYLEKSYPKEWLDVMK